ncbi:SIMPL domain-containing protein [Alloiococcus sp. CFN-8]|uniref:SIMPL domain-containing protein n=1 Tax=Alloiococcus sp. CFN-8 TaxID=3416081 RepID=UPI003CE800C3
MINYPMFSYGSNNESALTRGRIKVIGSGRINAAPDTAMITLGVVTEGKELEGLQEENAEISTRVIKAILSSGVPRDNIKTSSYTIEPQYDYQDGKQIFKGYRISNILSIEVTRLSEVGEIIDRAVNAGANIVQGVNFIIKNSEAYYNEALRAALRNAQSKALTLSQDMSIKIDRIPVSIIEKPSERVYGEVNLFKASAVTPIMPGTLEITAEITATFLYV